jgi:tetratricopeptide (TPR) repeat protein
MVVAQTEKSPDIPEIRLAYVEILRLKGDKDGYVRESNRLFAEPNVNFEYKQNILSDYSQLLDSETDRAQGLKLAATAAAIHPDNAYANSFYGDFLMATNSPDEARKYYLKAAALEPNNFKLWEQILGIALEQQQYDTLVRYASLTTEYFPSQPLGYFYEGLGYYMTKKYSPAADRFETAKSYSANNKMFLNQINSHLGDVYYNLKKYQLSDDAYEYVLRNDNNNTYVLNNWSYFLSLRKEKLEKAKEMSLKLIVLQPENPAYLDTYGWVLFVNNEYAEAKQYLEKAALISDDATIHEHYGDVLFRLGKMEIAITQWKKAYDKGADNPELLQRKIKEGKLIE